MIWLINEEYFVTEFLLFFGCFFPFYYKLKIIKIIIF